MEAVLRGDTAEHWLKVLDAAGVPCGPISDVAEAVGSEQARVRNMVVDAGGLPVPGNPVKTSAWPDAVTRTAAPDLDEHGAAVRAELSA
jgi:CoA:oxalate CoA-transferase